MGNSTKKKHGFSTLKIAGLVSQINSKKVEDSRYTQMLLEELDKDIKSIDMDKVLNEILGRQETRDQIDITKQLPYSKENALHLCLKNGHVAVLYRLLKYFDCTPAFRSVTMKKKKVANNANSIPSSNHGLFSLNGGQ
mmetsp:Transcript_18882/g.32250  ORF Transcript_18882/g.32250 Transcript_18882/m.32250 type:complete len:138 (+) Transcript_18882:242-655(+)